MFLILVVNLNYLQVILQVENLQSILFYFRFDGKDKIWRESFNHILERKDIDENNLIINNTQLSFASQHSNINDNQINNSSDDSDNEIEFDVLYYIIECKRLPKK